MKVSGIILAGGKSSRLGFNKLDINIEEVPLFIDLSIKLSFFCNEIIISTSSEYMDFIKSRLENLENYLGFYNISKKNMPVYNIVEDLLPAGLCLDNDMYSDGNNFTGFSGALKGIYSSLLASSNDFCLVLAADMPFISRRLLKLLHSKIHTEINGKKPDIILIHNIKGYETLCSVYSKRCIKYIEENILKGIFKITGLIPHLNEMLICQNELDANEIDMLNFFNINTYNDYIEFLDRIEEIKKSGNSISAKNFKKAWNELFQR